MSSKYGNYNSNSCIAPVYWLEGYNWYRCLVQNPDVPRKHLLEDYKRELNSIFIRWDFEFSHNTKVNYNQFEEEANCTKDGKQIPWIRYTKFDDIYKVRDFLKTKTSPITKTFFEIIFGNRRSRMYFDVDCDFTTGTLEDNYATILNDVTSCISWTLEDYGIPVEEQLINNWYIMTSNRDIVRNEAGVVEKEGRISIHIVLPFVVDSYEGRREIAYYVNKYGTSIGYSKNITDMAVYKKLNAFRLLGSHKALKMGADTKVFVPVWYFGEEEITTQLIDEEGFITPKLYNGWLQITSMANFTFSNFRVIVPKLLNKATVKFESVEFTEQEVTTITKLVVAKDPGLSYDSESNGRIMFNRCARTYCNSCKRCHDNRGKFAVVHHNQIYLYCLRACEEHDSGDDPTRKIPKPKEFIGFITPK